VKAQLAKYHITAVILQKQVKQRSNLDLSVDSIRKIINGSDLFKSSTTATVISIAKYIIAVEAERVEWLMMKNEADIVLSDADIAAHYLARQGEYGNLHQYRYKIYSWQRNQLEQRIK
jgi:hypothetical protein